MKYNLVFAFTNLDTRQLINYALDGFHYDGDIGDLEGSFSLSKDNDEWHVNDIDVAIAGESNILLDIQGDVTDATGTAKSELHSNLTISDPMLLEALTGLRVDETQLSANIKTTPGLVQVAAQARVGQTRLETSGELAYD